MLDQAAARGALEKRIALRQADALALPFDDQTFDVVTCQFGAMFFPDRVQGYNEARRVLKPGGRFVFTVWDRISENDFADVVTQALAGFFLHDPPRFLARVPHGYHDEECIRADLNAAGFVDILVDARNDRSKAGSPLEPAIAYCQGTPLRTELKLGMRPDCKTPRGGRLTPWRIDLEAALSRVASGHSWSPPSHDVTAWQTIPAHFGCEEAT